MATNDLDKGAIEAAGDFERDIYRARVLAQITATMLREGEDIDRAEVTSVLSAILCAELERMEKAAGKLARAVERHARRREVVDGAPTLGDA